MCCWCCGHPARLLSVPPPVSTHRYGFIIPYALSCLHHIDKYAKQFDANARTPSHFHTATVAVVAGFRVTLSAHSHRTQKWANSTHSWSDSTCWNFFHTLRHWCWLRALTCTQHGLVCIQAHSAMSAEVVSGRGRACVCCLCFQFNGSNSTNNKTQSLYFHHNCLQL